MRDSDSRTGRRRASRELLCQAAYRITLNPTETFPAAVNEMMLRFGEVVSPVAPDKKLAVEIGKFWETGVGQADILLKEVTGGEIAKIAIMERILLKLGAVEMINCVRTPPAVIINEWMEVAKRYGTEDSHTLINAVLDQLRAKLATIRPTERGVIRRLFFQKETGPGVLLGPGDDAAIVGTDGLLAVSKDLLAEGVHFAAGADPHLLGRKALAVNLSDLAAMGAEPLWAVLGLCLPDLDEKWLTAFVAGFREIAAEQKVSLIGGDMTSGQSRIISVTVAGRVGPSQLRQNGAKPEDLLWVSGSLGKAELDLKRCGGLGSDATQTQLNPVPRTQLGMAITGIATAATDLSDGLLAGAESLAENSGLAVRIVYEDLPVHHEVLSSFDEFAQRAQLALNGGMDYELLFSAPSSRSEEVVKLALSAGTTATCIGSFSAGKGVSVSKDGQKLPAKVLRRGKFEHYPAWTDDDSLVGIKVQLLAEAAGGIVCAAESCTSGLVAARLAEHAGASAWFAGGVVAYTAQAKSDLLGVSAELIGRAGVVSEEVALAMAWGARAKFDARWAVAVTGWAGPGGGDNQPAGAVYLGIVGPGCEICEFHQFSDGRDKVRNQMADWAVSRVADEIIGRG